MEKHTSLLAGVVLVGILACGSILYFATRDGQTSITTEKNENSAVSEENILENFTWEYQGLALGASINNETEPNILMSDVIRLDDGTYRMYYNAGAKGAAMIKYAESPDGLTNWTVKGIAIYGGTNPDDDDYIIGGSRVVQLQDGSWRMYYRATPDVDERTEPPSYSVYVATSTDGKTFTKYGVVIPNDRENPESDFTIAGHGAFYQLSDGTFAGFFSGNTKNQTTAPSDLFFTTSEDGLTWEEPVRMYTGVHDPTVVKTDEGYVVMAMYLKEWVGVAFSEDGLEWPEEMEKAIIVDTKGKEIDLQNIGDLSVTVGKDSTLQLYSNYAVENTRGIAEYTQE